MLILKPERFPFGRNRPEEMSLIRVIEFWLSEYIVVYFIRLNTWACSFKRKVISINSKWRFYGDKYLLANTDKVT